MIIDDILAQIEFLASLQNKAKGRSQYAMSQHGWTAALHNRKKRQHRRIMAFSDFLFYHHVEQITQLLLSRQISPGILASGRSPFVLRQWFHPALISPTI
ncbi:hypothetical protein D3C71_1468840 [compost metagenome]